MNPLHIPLTSLPAPVPMWTPTILHIAGLSISTGYPGASIDRSGPSSRYDVDLSPPPADASGHHVRIDALPILVDMLARGMGHPEGQRVFRTGSMRPDAWALETWAHGQDVSIFTLFTHDLGAPHDGTQYGGWTMAATETREILRRLPRIPALATIPLTSPHAHRLALAALFAARVWETA